MKFWERLLVILFGRRILGNPPTAEDASNLAAQAMFNINQHNLGGF